MKLILVTLLITIIEICIPAARAEFRTAKDRQKECRVALQTMNGSVDKNFENSLFTGECIGYVQAAVDASQVLAENVKWYKVCAPDSISTAILIEKFIAFVDAHPKYTLASTAIQMMLAIEYPCKN